MLGNVSAVFPPGELAALTGPAGSGKSLLLQLLAGVRVPTFGEVVWSGPGARPPVAYRPAPVRAGSFAPSEAFLTPSEQVGTALRLRVAGLGRERERQRTASLLERVGLAAEADRPAGTLTRDQRRRLALALELAGDPALLLWDETGEGTGGGDPAADPETERAFTRLLRRVAKEGGIAVVRVTRALDRLHEYDAVLVLHGGQLAFHGQPDCVAHYFQLGTPEALFQTLALRRPEEWHRSWAKHGAAYRAAPVSEAPAAAKPVRRPGGLSQIGTLWRRQWTVARRDLPALARQAAFFFGLPFAAALFAAGDLPRFQELAERLTGNVSELLNADALLAVEATRGVHLVTGLAMAQGLLLVFGTARTVSGAIAQERRLLEAETYRGLRTSAYLAGKGAFLFPWIAAQAAWMAAYIHAVCRLPGGLEWQMAVLALSNAAFASLCLAVSSFALTAGRARRICLVLAALQLPLSGTVLAPPEWLAWAARPLASIYWGVSAYLESMNGTRFYEVLQILNPLSPPALCLGILGAQILLGLGMAYLGCRMARLGVAGGSSGT